MSNQPHDPNSTLSSALAGTSEDTIPIAPELLGEAVAAVNAANEEHEREHGHRHGHAHDDHGQGVVDIDVDLDVAGVGVDPHGEDDLDVKEWESQFLHSGDDYYHATQDDAHTDFGQGQMGGLGDGMGGVSHHHHQGLGVGVGVGNTSAQTSSNAGLGAQNQVVGVGAGGSTAPMAGAGAGAGALTGAVTSTSGVELGVKRSRSASASASDAQEYGTGIDLGDGTTASIDPNDPSIVNDANAAGIDPNAAETGVPNAKRKRGPRALKNKPPVLMWDDPSIKHLNLPATYEGRAIEYSKDAQGLEGPVFVHPNQGTVQACIRCHGIKRKCDALEFDNTTQSWTKARCTGCAKPNVPCVFELAAASSG